jgi:phage terminase large subunit-like protein
VTTLDPVTRYAQGVISGTIIASRLVRLACGRHLRDLDEQQDKGLQWRAEEAQRGIEFFSEVLFLPEETTDTGRANGQPSPFLLSPFQAFKVGSLLGWYTAAGFRRFHIAYWEEAKGNGKTPLAAGLMLYLLVADGERGAQLFTAAVTKDQAKLAFADCEKMVNASPYLKSIIDQKVNNLAFLERHSFIRPVSSEKRGLDGKRVQGAVIDEQHEHPDDQVTAKIIAGIKGRPNALVIIPTNSGYDRETICYHYHDYSRQVLEGTVVNDEWFAFICHLDACDTCHRAGHYQPVDECETCDDWKTEGPHWLKANPNLGVSIPWSYVRGQVATAVGMPSQRNIIRRLNFCQWTQQQSVWISPESWQGCKGAVSTASLVGRECYLGIDLSDKIDLSSVVAIFPREMTVELKVKIGEGDDIPIDHALDVLPFFWMPRATLQRRSQEDNIPYPQWKKDGYLFATAGSMIDHDAIVDYIVTVLRPKYQIKGIGIDQSGAASVITRLRREFGEDFVKEIPQGYRRLNAPSRITEALVVSRQLAHPGNPLMDWCLSNMAVEENSWREIRPIKIDQRKRIDGGVALIVAQAAMLEIPLVRYGAVVRNLGEWA